MLRSHLDALKEERNVSKGKFSKRKMSLNVSKCKCYIHQILTRFPFTRFRCEMSHLIFTRFPMHGLEVTLNNMNKQWQPFLETMSSPDDATKENETPETISSDTRGGLVSILNSSRFCTFRVSNHLLCNMRSTAYAFLCMSNCSLKQNMS